MVAINDRSYDQLWTPTIDRTTNSVERRMGSDMNPRNISTFYSVSEQPIGGTTDRKVARPVARLIVRLVAEVVGDCKGQISRNKVDGHVQNLKPAIPNRKRSHD